MMMEGVEKEDASVEEWRKKYNALKEESETLKILSARAIREYDDLRRMYEENIQQYDELKERLLSSEAKLVSLQTVLEPACDEFNRLNERFEVERTCRSEAEVVASKFYHQNIELKRQSQHMLKLISDANIPVTDLGVITEDEGISESSSEEEDMLKKKISGLDDEIRILQDRLEVSENNRIALEEEKSQFEYHRKNLEADLTDMKNKVSNYELQMENLNAVSELAWTDYEQLREKYDRMLDLNQEAVVYANKMLSERDAVVRQSSILLSSAASDQRLMKALENIDKLTKELKMNEHKHSSQVQMLEQSLVDSTEATKFKHLDDKLQLATKEIEILQKSYKDLEKSYQDMDKWKDKLEKENLALINELDVAQQRLRPPPPPPPPPPPTPSALLRPFLLLVKKKDAAGPSLTRAGKPKDKTYEDAMSEMMERIKHGQGLKSVNSRTKAPAQETKESSAMQELQNALKKMKKVQSPQVINN